MKDTEVNTEIEEPEDDKKDGERRKTLAEMYYSLSKKQRVKMIIHMLLIAIPLLAFSIYCIAAVSVDRISTMDKYIQGSAEYLEGTETVCYYDQYDEEQVSYYEKLYKTSKEYYNSLSAEEQAQTGKPYYCNVSVGVRLEKIMNISSSSSSYEARMDMFFTFDKEEYGEMFREYASNVLWVNVLDDYYASDGAEEAAAGERVKSFETFLSEDSAYAEKHATYFENWLETNVKSYYPGENLLTGGINNMFTVGNGEFVANSGVSLKPLEEKVITNDDGTQSTICYQRVKFNASFEKSFDSVRYPLDSVQFKMYLMPVMDSQYIRYIPDRSLNEYGECVSGFSTFFGISGGYRTINETDDVKNFTLKTYYYQDVNSDPAIQYARTYKTELEITVRANRSGISLFLKAFINLFSVVIWIVIAFYNQSHNGEDSIGMLGTGLFGVISSMLVGLSMVSDAGIFSIITMINIFTLAVIMVMTAQSVAAKRANVRQHNPAITYNGIVLRLTFYLLIFCTVIMFVALPMSAFMFGV